MLVMIMKKNAFLKKNEIQFDGQTVLETEQETTLEPGEFMDKVMDKIEERMQEVEMKERMKNMKFPDFGGDK